VRVGGRDLAADFRAGRALVGLAPQEIMPEPFETPAATARLRRRLFGSRRGPARIEHAPRSLSLWDRRDAHMRTPSGGRKRRAMIAQPLAHHPRWPFLGEPTAGEDVAPGKSMWAVVRGLRDACVTILLTTRCIEEAEAMADRIGVMS